MRLPAEKEMVVLRILNDSIADMYAMQLVSASSGKLKIGPIYTTLTRMKTKGFVESRKPRKRTHPGLARPLYRITELGERVFHAIEGLK